MEARLEHVRFLLDGASITFAISITAYAIGSPLGLVIAIVRSNQIPVASPLLAVYVSFLRSIPLPLLMLLFYFGLPVFGVNLNPFVAGIICLALNTSAFNGEIWRGAILDFPNDQLEAAKSFGMTPKQTFRRIVLPQIWRASIPLLANELTFVVKASPAIVIIGINELTGQASEIAASSYEPLPIFLTATGMYMIVLLALSRGSRAIDYHFQSKYELL